MKKLTVGILAHVDAGKTTLTEAILYSSGSIRKLGRVDNRDSFMDTDDEERKRGITIFSKPAKAVYKDLDLTFIDTPGHVDFSGEMERTLQILDYAILVISGTDGAQSHTKTLMSLLEDYNVPVFIFVTKMDVSKYTNEELMKNLQDNLSPNCIDFSSDLNLESVALCDDEALDRYLSSGTLSRADITGLVSRRKIIPCIFGSGLKMSGITALLDAVNNYSADLSYPSAFSARVFKIFRDNLGKRLTFIKITGGTLHVKDTINGEKINQIKIYSGNKSESTDTVSSGDICAVIGPESTFSGQSLGKSTSAHKISLCPVMTYSVILPKGTDAISVYPIFKQLEEEDPLLNIVWDERYRQINIQLMGKVQIDVLKNIIKSRFSLDVNFGSGKVLYKETISAPVEGIGHYEPLKHYAEVHLLIEPLPRGSGIQIESQLSSDDLDINWQRLILSHISEKQHIGILTGSPITDIKITLIAGKAHLKHTEGGDFRQATYRAIRQGLMQSESVLLEPFYEFTLEVPNDCVGRAISDIHQKCGIHAPPITKGDLTLIKGTVPAVNMSDYSTEVLSYTSGRGKLSLRFSSYDVCHNPDSVINEFAYDPLSDIENTADSVFCSHGSGTVVPWDKVNDFCHIKPIKSCSSQDDTITDVVYPRNTSYDFDEAELENIMLREFGPIRRKTYRESVSVTNYEAIRPTKNTRIIIDGYNVIYSWNDLKKLSADNIDLARNTLIDMLVNYQAFTGHEVVLVFDAYLVQNGQGKKYDDNNLHIVYTAQGESADAYIEKLIDEIGSNENVRVVTSDNMIQITAVKTGVLRISSSEFKYEVDNAISRMREKITKY